MLAPMGTCRRSTCPGAPPAHGGTRDHRSVPGRMDPLVGECVRQVRHLEGKARRRCAGVVADHQGSGGELRHQSSPQRRFEPRLLSQREQGPRLHPGCPGCAGLRDLLGRRIATGQPERQTDAGDLLQVRVVPGAIHGLAVVVQDLLPRGGEL